MHLHRLWKPGLPLPTHGELSFAPQARDVVVHRPGGDAYGFLHDGAVVHHEGLLHAAWYNCPSGEIVGESVIRERTSADGGRTWSEPRVIAQDVDRRGVFYVPVQFLSHHGRLYAFVSTMTGHDQVTGCEAFLMGDDGWRPAGRIAEGLLPNCAPVLLPDGNHAMAGRMTFTHGGKPLTPAVAISRGGDVTEPWDVAPLLPAEASVEGVDLRYPEATVIAEPDLLTALVRNEADFAIVFLSRDNGRTWRGPFAQDMPLGAAKMYAGVLSTGSRYVIFNMPTDGYRDLLVIAVSEPGERLFSRMWKLRDGPDEALGLAPEWSYPSATEHDGLLHVVYTSAKQSCAMTTVPVTSL